METGLRALETNPDSRYQKISEVKTGIETIASTPTRRSRREEAEKNASAIDRKLNVFAALFIFAALSGLGDMLLSDGSRNMSIHLGAFCLPIGIGLLHRRKRCTELALLSLFAWGVMTLVMLGLLFGKAFGAFSDFHLVTTILGRTVDSRLGAFFTFATFAAQGALVPWMILVLIRYREQATDIRRRIPMPWLEWGTLGLIILVMTGAIRLPWPNPRHTGVAVWDPDPQATAGSTPASSAITQDLSFGPSVELVVTNMVDFDSGTLADLPLPTQPGERDPERYDWINGEGLGVPWMRDHRFDAINANHGLICVDLMIISLESGDWSDLTPPGLRSKLDHLQLPTAPASSVVPQETPVGFETREGTLGMLEVVDTRLSTGVKIRYKLVQNTPPAPDYPTALRTLKSAMPTLEALDGALEQDDLDLAGTLTETALRQMEAYNLLVAGTTFEISEGALDAFSLGIEAIRTGELKRAKSLFESSMNSVDVDLPEKLEALVTGGTNTSSLLDDSAEPRLIFSPARFEHLNVERGQINWDFKCFVPANHLASILYVRWTDGVPEVDPGFSAY